jgi:uncharacterized 2Fe-2S/4Fe-4S cluster protein (DUF4445 family)
VPTLLLRRDGVEQRFRFPEGVTLRDVLFHNGVAIPTACPGDGTCGACRVRLDPADAPPPTDAETARLDAAELADGLRLACQVWPTSDLRARLDEGSASHGPEPSWRPMNLPPSATGVGPAGLRPGERGVAVDLGTTQVRVSLWDLERPRRMAAVVGLNPQVTAGADVLARLSAAARTSSDAARLATAAREAVGAGLRAAAAAAGCPLTEVGRLAVVGNSAMIALAAGNGAPALLDPANWERALEFPSDALDDWPPRLGLGPTAVRVPAPAGGFVGSDLLAAVAATGLCATRGASLLVDFGTNSEIALWDGRRLWATSAAGGPAFEGCGISCGMPASRGAVVRVRAGGSGEFDCEVAGGGDARGLSGSGLVDAVALLVEQGVLSAGGRANGFPASGGFPIHRGRRVISIRQRDVGEFQRAKAAIAAAAELLAARAGVRLSAVGRLCICGAFGEFLDASSAARVGLLPPVPESRIDRQPAAALIGCERVLLAGGPAAPAGWPATVTVVNLAGDSRYEERFVANLRLGPMSLEEGV